MPQQRYLNALLRNYDDGKAAERPSPCRKGVPYLGPVRAVLVFPDRTHQEVVFADYESRAARRLRSGEAVGILTTRDDGRWGGQIESRRGTQYLVDCPSKLTTCVTLLLALKSQADAAQAVLEADPERWLDEELARYDWTAHFSDDDSVYRASERHRAAVIDPLIRRVGAEKAKTLWEKRRPTPDYPFPDRLFEDTP
jgi:hypothetical protein